MSTYDHKKLIFVCFPGVLSSLTSFTPTPPILQRFVWHSLKSTECEINTNIHIINAIALNKSSANFGLRLH